MRVKGDRVKFSSAKFYILKNGVTQTCLIKTETPTAFNRFSNILRDKSKLLVEITRNGMVYLSLRNDRFILSSKQIDTINSLKTQLRK